MPKGPVRVLHIAPSLGLGGTEKVMQSFVCHLDRSRYQAAVYSASNGPRAAQIRESGIDTYIGSDLFRVLSTFRPHVAHIHRAGWPEPEPLKALRAAGVPVVVETNVFGRHDPSPSGKIIDRHLFVSHFCSRRYQAAHGIDTSSDRYGVLYNPVDTDLFGHNCPMEREFPVWTAGRISRPDPGKWSGLALEFLPLALKQLPELKYRVIGGIPEAEEWVRCRGYALNVDFLPPVQTDEELAAFFNSISLLAHANDTGESFGLVIAEAMAAGLPVVTHPCPPPRDNAQVELVEHGVTGFVASTPAEYAEAVVWLLSHPQKARELGEAGRRKAAREYRVQHVVAQLQDTYEELLAAKGVSL